MRIEILDNNGNVENTIIAETAFTEEHYPGKWRIAADQDGIDDIIPWKWYIDIGPFFDRFGAAKMVVLTSTDAGVQAIIKDAQVRKWLDLKLPEIASAVAYIGTKVPAVTQGLQQSILNTPVVETENLALRKLYFS